MDIIDLDILKTESRKVKLGGKEIDISFIPVAITFRVNEIAEKLFAMKPKELENDLKKAEEGFDLAVKLCALFCEHSHPEFDEKWFRSNTTVGQVQVFAREIRKTLYDSMQGLERYASKNEEGAKTVS
jgi:hypothetical protein